jgi:O-antigen/teichoic acid export membrane protein
VKQQRRSTGLRHQLAAALPSGTFLSGVATLMGGTALAQAVPMLAAPVLTRLYSPSDFGALALFTAVAAVGGVVACARYELAIVLPDDEADVRALAFLSIGLAATIACLLQVFMLVASPWAAEQMGNPSIAPWLLLVPIVVFLIGLFNTLNYVITRSAGFPLLARARVAQALSGSGSQVGLGTVWASPGGLIVGNALSASVAVGALVRRARDQGYGRRPSLQRVRAVARRYSDFPKYSIVSALAQTSSLLLVSVVLTRFYSAEVLGEYALVLRVLGLPLTLIAGTVGQVYFQQASAALRESGSILEIFHRTLRALTVAALVSSALAFFLLPTVFGVVFSSEWRGAGTLARNLLPGFTMQFIVAPLTMTNLVNNKVRLGLIGDLALLMSVTGTLIAAATLDVPAHRALLYMSLAQAATYAIYLGVIYRHVRAGRADVAS